MNTIAEDLFERYCDLVTLKCNRIPTSTIKTPDYRIFPCGQEVVVEIKQIDPNKEEEEALAAFDRGEVVVTDGTPGERVRSEILKARDQLARDSRKGLPALLVLYNNVFLRFHTDPYQILVGMYGLEQFIIAVPNDPKVRPYFKGKKFGPKRRMTPDHNTTISAIGVITLNPLDDENSPALIVYHNVFARNPFNPELLRPYSVSQFTLPEAVPGKRQEWIAL